MDKVNRRLRRGLRRRWTRAVGAALVLGVLLYGLLVVISHRVEEQARRAWILQGGGLEELVRRYPSRETNPLARRVEAVTAEMGIRLVPRWDEQGPAPAPVPAGQWESLRRLMSDSLNANLQLDLELTRHWLALGKARRADGRWPGQLPRPAASKACPGERWLYGARPGGGIEVRFSRALPAPPRGLALPLRYRTGS